MDQFSKLAVTLIIVALTAVATVAPASGAGFFFSNNSGISIPAVGAAAPYASTINVSGVTGTVTHVVVGLENVSHTFPDDIDMLLVSPSGVAVLLMSDAGGGGDIGGVNLIFSDCAPACCQTAAGLHLGASGPRTIRVPPWTPSPPRRRPRRPMEAGSRTSTGRPLTGRGACL